MQKNAHFVLTFFEYTVKYIIEYLYNRVVCVKLSEKGSMSV